MPTTPRTSKTTAPRPPADRGQGRPKLPDAERRTLRSIRLRPAQWEVFNEVGGVRWLEDALELAKKSIQRAAVNAGPGAAEKESPPS